MHLRTSGRLLIPCSFRDCDQSTTGSDLLQKVPGQCPFPSQEQVLWWSGRVESFAMEPRLSVQGASFLNEVSYDVPVPDPQTS